MHLPCLGANLFSRFPPPTAPCPAVLPPPPTRRYLQPLVESGRLKAEELGETIFASKPSSGGAVLRLKL